MTRQPSRRVLFLAYHFPPIGGAGVQRSVKFVKYLAEFGYEPVVVTGPGGASDHYTPEDKTMESEIPAGTEVHRVAGPEPKTSRGWRRRAERLFEVESPFSRWWIDGAVALGRQVGGDTDLIYCAAVPYLTTRAAVRLARELDKPWVADLQDPWALDEIWVYPTGIHRRRDRTRMRKTLSTADAVIMNTPEAASRVRREFPELENRLVPAIPNGFDADDFAEPFTMPADDRFRIVHTGYLYTQLGLQHRRTARLRQLLGGLPVQGIDYLPRSHVYLLEAIERLLKVEPELSSAIEVHLAGVLTDEDREIAANSSVVRLHGYLPHPETVRLIRSAQLLFLPMHDLPPGTRAGLVPGKTYDYLGSGRPILAALPDGDARDLLSEAGNAFICRPTDTTQMAEIIAAQIRRWRAREPAAKPREDVVARYERRRQTADLAQVLDTVSGRKSAVAKPEAYLVRS